jgi:4-hydroxy-2-oxoheptanedioate aldolase
MTSFAAELRAGGPVPICRRGLWLTFLSPFGLEVAAAGGAEWIAIDIQHGDLDLTDVAPLARVSPVPVLVRLGSHDEAQLARVLDAGVDGMIVPAVESGAQAEQLVQAACFAPRGRRSKGLARVSLLGPRDQPLLLPMVETRAGLDHLDDILGVDGVDGIFVGPYDLTLSLGQESVLEGGVVSAIESIIDRTRGRGRITGIFTGNRELTGLPRLSTCSASTPTASGGTGAPRPRAPATACMRGDQPHRETIVMMRIFI